MSAGRRFLAAAKDLFIREGYEKVTTLQLAERAGLSQTGLYVSFEQLWAAPRRRHCGRSARRRTAGPDAQRLFRIALENPTNISSPIFVTHAPLKGHEART
jgi:hypothetical protein